jgi:hypothetical protein
MHLRQWSTTPVHSVLAKGLPWLAWGLTFLLIAVGISMVKGGVNPRIGNRLSQLNQFLRPKKRMH